MNPTIISGDRHTDQRGTLSFVNDFDLKEVRRFYTIRHPSTEVVRAWRGHRIEQRWFYVATGIFFIKVLKIDNWERPNPSIKPEVFKLSATDNKVLYVPNGYATGIQAGQENSELLVFGDHTIEHAKKDDYLFPIDYFGIWKAIQNEN